MSETSAHQPQWQVSYRAPNVRLTVTKLDTFGPVDRFVVHDHGVDHEPNVSVYDDDQGWTYPWMTRFQTLRLLERLGVGRESRWTLLDGHSVTVNV